MRWMGLLGAVVLIAAGCGDDGDQIDYKRECPVGDDAEPCQIFHLVNQERASVGLEPYDWDPALALAAQSHCEDMVKNDYFSHTGADGSSFSDRAYAAGYDGSPRGENIAQGYASPELTMEQWMESTEGHRENILASGSDEIGVGFCGGNTWVQVFGRSEQ